MKIVNIILPALASGFLYGLAWPFSEQVNLSFLAWFAFVPLFLLFERNQRHFWENAAAATLATVIYSFLIGGWSLKFPRPLVEMSTILFLTQLRMVFPFLLLLILQRRIGFDRALWLFPLIWMSWDWIYLNLEFTVASHLSAYSQSSNTWLIQYIDLTGMWGIAFWLTLFNVLIFKAYKNTGYNLRQPLFYKKIALLALPMLGLPLLYAWYAFSVHNDLRGEHMNVSLIPTQYSAARMLEEGSRTEMINETLHRNDSLALAHRAKGQTSDIYVWPETAAGYWLEYSNLGGLLQEAVTDWGSALLIGCKGTPADRQDPRTYVSGALLSHRTSQALYHHKTVLVPGQEAIPYHKVLARLPKFPIALKDPRFYKKGERSAPLELLTQNDEAFKIGVSLCFEQWYPQHWTRLAQNGADFYIHLASEGWYGNIGFQQFMANVTRLRCIENRRQAARCANVGLSLFIDQMGNIHHQVKTGTINTTTADLQASGLITWYAKHPNWFPLLGLATLAAGLIFFPRRRQ